jgi:hypothetical protein
VIAEIARRSHPPARTTEERRPAPTPIEPLFSQDVANDQKLTKETSAKTDSDRGNDASERDPKKALDRQAERIADMIEQFEESSKRATQFFKESDLTDPPGPQEIQRRVVEAAVADQPGLAALVQPRDEKTGTQDRKKGEEKLDVVV